MEEGNADILHDVLTNVFEQVVLEIAETQDQDDENQEYPSHQGNTPYVARPDPQEFIR